MGIETSVKQRYKIRLETACRPDIMGQLMGCDNFDALRLRLA
jgi:hypothetical protein